MNELKIIVCLKQVPDPEGPSSAFKIDSEAKRVVPTGIPPVINPFDENALEAALKLRDNHGGKIIGLSMGDKLARPVLSKALGVGADELLLLEDVHFKDLDSFSTANVLAKAIEKIGEYSIVLTGRQAGDWDFGQTGLIVAEMLHIPAINLAQKIKIEGSTLIVEKLKRNAYEIVKVPLPALVTVSSEVGDLRSVPLAAIKAAREKPIHVWSMTDLGIDLKDLSTRSIQTLVPPSIQKQCVFIDGESPVEKGEKLALKLREEKVL
jgi:electron transfer flavoprotein beta subunit